MKRDHYQRRTYAADRAFKAIQRMRKAKGKAAKEQAARWAALWGYATGLRQFD